MVTMATAAANLKKKQLALIQKVLKEFNKNLHGLMELVLKIICVNFGEILMFRFGVTVVTLKQVVQI